LLVPTFRSLRAAIVCASLLLPALSAAAQDAPTDDLKEAPVALDPSTGRVGEMVDDIAFTDIDSHPLRTADVRGVKAAVVCFTGVGCPVARKVLPTIAALEKAYRAKGVAFILVNPNAQEKVDDVRAAALAAGFAGRVVHDPSGSIARALRATSSTEAFVIDAGETLQYRGAVDDQYGLGYQLAAPRRRYLAEAIDAVLAGELPQTRATTAPGCALDIKGGESPSSPRPVTYHNRISRLVQNNCLECHRTGEAAPFTLATYDEVKGHAAMIRKVVSKGIMPPWFASPETPHAFGNDRRLSDRDKADLLAWINAGTPQGDPADAPVTRAFAEGWRIGKPDAVLQPSRSFQIPATGEVKYQRTLVGTTFDEDKWVQAVEIRPTSPAVVHHVLVFLVYPPDRVGQQPQYNDGLTGYFAGLVPGQGATVFPPGTAKLLPRGASMIFQIHYTPDGTATEDRPKIGLVFADKAPDEQFITYAAFNNRFRIPPGADDFKVTADYTFKGHTKLTALMPHTHVRGKSFRYELTYPDGRTETILDVPRYDFNWQLEYRFRTPLDLPAGTRMRATAHYDNSANNPANPDPTKQVRFGDQTWEEMMIGYFAGYRAE
jgi:hypothetical protein